MDYKSFDSTALLEQFAGDEEILLDMLVLFEETWPDLLSPLKKSIMENDNERLKVASHTLKGIFSNFFVKTGVNLARELEDYSKKELSQEKRQEALNLADQIEEQVTFFLEELKVFKKSSLANF